MRFDIITIFPDIFDSYFSESLIKKAQDNDLIEINTHDLREYSENKWGDVDGKPYGGGRGMVMKVEPIYRAVKNIKLEDKKSKVILFTPRGKDYTQKKATEYSNLDQLIIICGRYEGVDERVRTELADESISIGNYVLIGGEIPAMAVVESVSRLVPGVVGIDNEGFLDERVRGEGMVEYPQYSRPEVFETDEGNEWKVPEVLLSGHHKKINEWRDEHGEVIK
ncbi:MAG: tRNA (guanosine(37)-N1)-methyltransferase TrmD [Patescibacteria group bacterium]